MPTSTPSDGRSLAKSTSPNSPVTSTTIYSTLHGPIVGGASTQQAQIVSKVPDVSLGYHNYWVRHLEDEITFGIDDLTLGTLTPESLGPDETWVYNRPMYAILNLGVGVHGQERLCRPAFRLRCWSIQRGGKPPDPRRRSLLAGVRLGVPLEWIGCRSPGGSVVVSHDRRAQGGPVPE